MFWLGVAALILVLLAIGTFVYLRRRKERLAREAAQQAELEEQLQLQAQAAQTAALAAEAGENVSPEDAERLTERQALEEMIRTRPEDVAQLVKTWLSDDFE